MVPASSLQVALVSDTHGQVDERIAMLARDCDVVVHAGDIGGSAVLQALRPPSDRLYCVRGNNDVAAKWPAREHPQLQALPESIEVALPGGVLAVVHGHRAGGVADRHARLRRQFPTARAIVYGHSHRLVCDQDEPVWVLNPGAAGRTRTFGGPSCLILSAGIRAWRLEALRFPKIR